jgi:hypothetical protein
MIPRLLLLAALSFAVGCVHASSLQMPLLWSPTESATEDVPASALTALSRQAISIVSVGMRPAQLARVGENREGAQARLVTTSSDVSEFVRAHIAELFTQNAVRVVPSGGTRVVKLAVKDFFVAEGNTYQGRVILDVVLEDGAGHRLWDGVVSGTNTRWGRSFNQENYEQCLTDSTIAAFKHLLAQEAFQRAMSDS